MPQKVIVASLKIGSFNVEALTLTVTKVAAAERDKEEDFSTKS